MNTFRTALALFTTLFTIILLTGCSKDDPTSPSLNSNSVVYTVTCNSTAAIAYVNAQGATTSASLYYNGGSWKYTGTFSKGSLLALVGSGSTNAGGTITLSYTISVNGLKVKEFSSSGQYMLSGPVLTYQIP